MINISKPFITRPVATILVMLTILVFGMISYNNLPVSDLPNVDYPTIKVEVDYPGATPKTMANTCATPLEKEFMTIDGLDSITSSSINGKTTLILQFNLNKPIDSASQDVSTAINRAQPNLPKDLPNNPTFRKENPSATPILYLGISSDSMDMPTLYDYANTYIGQRLGMIEGVSQVETYGSPYAARIQVDPEKLSAMKVGLNDVATAIQKGNVDLPTGKLFGDKNEFTIDVDGQLERAEGYNELSIKTKDGSIVKIHQIGRALDSLQHDKYYVHFISKLADKEVVVLAVQRQPGKNTVRVINAINELLPKLKRSLPSSLVFHRIFDKSDSINESVADVKLTLFIAFVLVVAVIYLILGKLFDTIAPSAALPMSIIGTFSVMYLLGFSIDILSMLALTLSIGFLVDDAIVVLENNVRHVQMGKSAYNATMEGSQEIGMTIFSMTSCLVAVFIPMLFLPGVVGRLFREFAVTIVVAVFISGFVSLTLTPLLCSRFIKRRDEKSKTTVEKISDRLNNYLLSIYKKLLTYIMKHKLCVVAFGIFSLSASIFLFISLPKDFLPPDDIGFLQGATQAVDGTSPFEMARYQANAGKIIVEDDTVEYLLSIASVENDNEGLTFVKMKPYKERGPMDGVIDKLMKKLAIIPGLNSYLFSIPLINLQIGTHVKGLYQYTLTSVDTDTLNKYSAIMLNRMQKLPGFSQVASDMQINQPQLEIKIDRDRASDLNISAKTIEDLFKFAYSDEKISTINSAIDQYDVIMETLPKYYRNPETLSKLFLKSDDDNLVPITEVASFTQDVAPLMINHYNGLPSTTISFDLINTSLGDAVKNVEKLKKELLPETVSAEVVGTALVFKESFKNLTFLFLVTIFVIYVILGILYESFIHPITVMSTLAPAALGGLFTLYIFNETLSLYAFIGLIMLLGIVMKNGIMMVDFANKERSENKKNAEDAIISASLTRFRPIMMTTIAAFMGALPIAIGVGGASARARSSLGLVVVGGLVISQILTLFLTPVTYYYLEILQEKIFKKTSTKKPQEN